MIKSLIDSGEKRDIVIFYGNNSVADIAYTGLLDDAEEKLGIKVIYSLADQESIPPDWQGIRGYVTEAIKKEVPDYRERSFYISGPRAMVTAYENTLRKLGVKKSRIKLDFFPGFA